MKTPLLISILIVAVLIGIGIGYSFTPSYQQMNTMRTMSLGTADRWVDLRYIDAMIAHHRSAVLMAEEIAPKTTRPEIQALAAEIQQEEPKLIAELYDWKQEWFGDTRAVKDEVIPQFGAADETVDLRFLNALIAHHERGIIMTQEIKAKSSRAQILDNADAVEIFLQETLISLQQLRQEWYGIN